MKFKIVKGTPLFNRLMKLHERAEKANAEALKVAKSLGGVEVAKSSSSRSLGGGIDAIHFKNEPDMKQWKVVGYKYQKLYMPRASAKKLWALITPLKEIPIKELNEAVCFKAPQTISKNEGLAWISSVGIVWGKDVILMEVADGCKYSVPTDVVEILSSEYEKLESQILSKRKVPRGTSKV